MEALDELLRLTVSNQDLKLFSKSDILGFAGGVSINFSLQKAPAGLLNFSYKEIVKRNIQQIQTDTKSNLENNKIYVLNAFLPSQKLERGNGLHPAGPTAPALKNASTD